MDFQLDMSIDTQDLRTLKAAGMRIVLAKPVGSSSPNVVWISFDPFEGNVVNWTEEYGLYASNSQLISGASIVKISSAPFPAQDGKYYSFRSDATFYGPNTGGDIPSLGSFRVFNEMPSTQYPSLLFGLMQSARVNGKTAEFRPLNANVVPSGTNATFTPLTTVHVWLQSNLVSGTVLVDVTSKVTIVTFGNGVTKQQLRYDPAKGQFIPFSNESQKFLTDLPHIQLLEPSV